MTTPPSPTQDVLSLIRLLLLEDSGISAKVGDRISGPSASRSGTEKGEDLFPRIVIEAVGGGGMASGALQQLLVHIYGYSRISQADAWAIFDLVRPALRMARLSRDGIVTKGAIRESGSPASGMNPDLGAWFARGSFKVNATNLPPT